MLREYDQAYATEEFMIHGELQLQEKFKSVNFDVVFDVGANVGEWTRMVRSFQPNAHIHTFEVIPETYDQMLRNNVLDDKIYPNSYGLSNKTQHIPVNYVANNSRVSTSVLNYHHDNMVTRNVLVTTGAEYCLSRGIRFIDYLKIDCEGHDFNVLEGFADVLAANAVTCIQMEYGLLNILTRHLLLDYYSFLTKYNFVLGKLSPRGVDFKPYHLTDENFRGEDVLAIHSSRPDLIDLARAQ